MKFKDIPKDNLYYYTKATLSSTDILDKLARGPILLKNYTEKEIENMVASLYIFLKGLNRMLLKNYTEKEIEDMVDFIKKE